MKKFIPAIVSALKIFLAVFFLISIGLYLFQEKIIFYPIPLDDNSLADIRRFHPQAQDIDIESNDGKNLHGWIIDNTSEEHPPSGMIFYYGGNAEEVSHRIGDMSRLPGWIVILMNYRGYGLSEGRPGERMIFEDALKIYDHFNSIEKYSEIRKVTMGWSLGTGVAVHVAHERKIDGVFLISPYDSITNIAKRTYPFLPIEMMIRHPFDSIGKAPSINSPLRIIAASNDKIIPPSSSINLASQWGGDKDILIVENYDHNSLINSLQYKKYFEESLVYFNK
jgi:uncharacterized protein